MPKGAYTMLTGNQIREAFLNYFKDHGHTIVASSSLVPSNDPTLLFVNAGMVQFKDTFLGNETRDYTRATSSQRCVRAGGKHNDLENVGHTARHHTFFEMLGNFSFGDYFKKEAIPFAWNFLTEVLEIPAERLLVTVYHTDDEAYDIWHKTIGLPEDRIIKIATNDNFWSMGADGPCGPCTEIFYDHGDHIWGGKPGTPEEDGDRFVEIWNIVFMQDLMQDGEIVAKLGQTGVDTGSGLERLTAVAQGVHSNYDIDIFQTIIQEAARLTGHTYGENETHDVSLRVLADHLRSMCFMLVDGVMPSNEGRGYVLRRIMRRAMRHGNLLGMEKPFIYKLVKTLVQVMGDAYPELTRAQKMVEDTIELEEGRFNRTLSQGLKLLDEETKDFNAGDVLSGDVAFKLYDTYGFPLDLTQDALRQREIGVDTEGFEKAMQEQRDRARKASLGTGQDKLSPVWFTIRDRVEANEFLGYKVTKQNAQLQALVMGDKEVKTIKKGDKATVVVNQTPFYGESGGQVGDQGTVKTKSGVAKVLDTQKLFDGHIIQHFVEVTEGELNTNEEAEMIVDEALRLATVRNHSAVHLFHAAVREVLGDHVFQKGSLVTPEKLRFDFSHNKALTAEEIEKCENIVNELILRNTEVTTRLMGHEEAIEAGALALFGEKYGDEVRVLTMGEVTDNPSYSVELCGGTHVSRTGDIGLFKVTAESSISAGVRRVEGVTGHGAFEYLRNREKQLVTAAQTLKTSPDDLSTRLDALQNEIKTLKKDLKEAQKGGGASGGSHADNLMQKAETVGDFRFIGASVPGVATGILRELVDDLKNKIGSGVIVIASDADGKATLCAGVTKDLTSRFNAGKLVNAAAEVVGGKGGGRPDMAMAGGKDTAKLDDAIKAARALVN